MNKKISFKFGSFLKLISLVVLGLLVGILVTLKVQVFLGPKQTVSITGTGQVEAATDKATITAQVKNTAATQELSQIANKKDVETLGQKLRDLGIPQSRITQSSFIPPYIFNSATTVTYDSTQGMGMMRPIPIPDNSLTTTTSVTVVLDPIKDITKVLAVISNNPDTQVMNSSYSVKDMQNWETKAKEAALKDARSQVEAIAKINGLSVGKLVSITDQSIPYPIAEPMMLNNTMRGQSGSAVALDKTVTSAGVENIYYSEQSVNVTATYYVTYELNSKLW